MNKWIINITIAVVLILAGVVYAVTVIKQPEMYTLNTSKMGMGSVRIGGLAEGADSIQVKAGTKVTLTAVPAQGYIFSGWSGDHSGSGSPTVVTVDRNMRVTAIFSAK